jgi:hypothetical protein
MSDDFATGVVTTYRRFSKPGLGPPGDDVFDLDPGGGDDNCAGAFQQRDRRVGHAASVFRQAEPALRIHARPVRNGGEREMPAVLHKRTGRPETGLGNAPGILQPSLRPHYRSMGAQVL